MTGLEADGFFCFGFCLGWAGLVLGVAAGDAETWGSARKETLFFFPEAGVASRVSFRAFLAEWSDARTADGFLFAGVLRGDPWAAFSEAEVAPGPSLWPSDDAAADFSWRPNRFQAGTRPDMMGRSGDK